MKRWISHIAVNAVVIVVALTDYLVANGSVVGLAIDNPKTATLAVAGINLANIGFKAWLAGRKTRKPKS